MAKLATDAAYPLASGEVLDVADALRGTNGAERGMLLLSAARPHWPAEALRAASLGDREAWALALRCAMFGERLAGRTVCPACRASLALDFDATAVFSEPAPKEPRKDTAFEFGTGDYRMTVRPPDGAILAAAAMTGDRLLARDALLSACISDVQHENGPVEWRDLPDDVVEAVGEEIVGRDTQAEVRLTLTCASCEHAWTCLLDAGMYLAAELENLAAHLVEDVHVLAAAYGWSEDEILALPSRRRRRYVERAVSG